MVSEKNRKALHELKAKMKEYPVIGIVNMHKLPGRQLHEIRNKLREEAVICMVKKNLIIRALDEIGIEGIAGLSGHVSGEPALIMSKTNPFRLARIIEKSKSPAVAKPGDLAPQDILIKAGPTSLPPGPVIGELQRVKLPAGVQGDKISILKDTVIARKGDKIGPEVAAVLAKLGIQPMEISLNVTAAWEAGVVYASDILFVPMEEYDRRLKAAVASALNLSINAGYVTSETVPLLLAKACREADALAACAGIATPATLGAMLASANAEAGALAGMVKPLSVG